MPDRSVLPFTVRTFEVDATGQVLPATYMRWFQEAAIFASAANGFDEERYHKLGSTWFLREFHLEVQCPPKVGETIEVYTWAASLERVTAHRQYTARRPNGDVIANGEGEWIYIDRATGRPRRIDRDPMKDFPLRAERVLEDRDWGTNLLEGYAGDAEVNVLVHRVLWSELDGAGHVNNAVYAEWVVDHIAAATVRGQGEPTGPGKITRLRLRFQRGARAGETLEWRLQRADERTWLHETRVVPVGETVARAVVELG